MKNYYEILEISELAGADEIKKKYRKLMMKYHPDRHDSNPLVELAVKEVQKYQEAYETLGDEDKKRWYDLELKKIRYEKMNPSVNHRDPAPPRYNPEPDHAAAAEEKHETDYDSEEEYLENDETEEDKPSELSVFIVKVIFKVFFIGMIGFWITKSMKGFVIAVLIFYGIKIAIFFDIPDRISRSLAEIRYLLCK